tara:strand:- start:683 stop:1078 length:396 start_codon:yes stop_codon:yes gene_type:complete
MKLVNFLIITYRVNDFIKNKYYNSSMKYFIPLVCLIFSLQSIARDEVRPGPHNKIGHTKQSQQDKENSFVNKVLNNNFDFMESSQNTNKTSYNDIDATLSQIEKLADLKKQGIITDDEFNSKKSVLLDKIQ